MHLLPLPRWLIAVFVMVLASGSLFAKDQPLGETIDAAIQAAWQREQVKAAPASTDAAFLRRVYLDLVGTIPTADEAEKFLADSDAKKRVKLIQRLLDDPRFAAHQTDVWDQVLFGRNPLNGDATRKRDGFKKWLGDKFAKNEPYDRWVRDLLLAEQEGSALFLVQYRNQPEEATVAVSRLFLGMQLQCARCHDHPYEAWTQRDFYGMAGFFVRLVVLEQGADGKKQYGIGEKSTGEVLFAGPAKELKPGQKGEPIKPKFLGGDGLDEPALPKDFKEVDFTKTKSPPKPVFSRKEKLAEWVTDPKNPYFARAAVNRVWAQYLGRGLVHPVDDLREKNPSSHPDLLKRLIEEFEAHKYDLRWLIGELVATQTYQLGSRGGDSVDAEPRWFERARVRPLSAEEMMSVIKVATGAGDAKLPGSTEEYFVRYFGEPADGQGRFQAGLGEHLLLNNSGELRQLLRPKKGNLADYLVNSKDSWEQKVDRLFLAVLTRKPRDTERKRFVEHLTSGAKTDALVEEAIWALVNGSEFRFNH